jgi:hydrogenase expression/formation protein HypC
MIMCLGIPSKILEFYSLNGLRMAKVDLGGVTREACLEALPEAVVGDYVIIHAGFALNLLSEQEAIETLKALNELAEIARDIPLEVSVDQSEA